MNNLSTQDVATTAERPAAGVWSFPINAFGRRPSMCHDVHAHSPDACAHCIVNHQLPKTHPMPVNVQKTIERINVHHLRPNGTLFEAGTKSDMIFAVRSGLIKLVHQFHNGDYRIVRLLRAGDVAGLNALVGGTHNHTAIAISHAEVCRIPVETLPKLYSDQRDLHKGLMQRWQKSIDDAELFVGELCTGRAEARVARLLLHLDDGSGNQTIPRLSREDMGAMLGISRETASRVMADFRRRQLIKPAAPEGYRFDRKGLVQITHDM